MSYKSLFEIQFFHHYFLDHGQAVFDAQNPLVNNVGYNVKQFLEIIPLPKTQLLFKNHRYLFKKTSLGISILTKTIEETISRNVREKPLITPSSKDKAVFAIRVTDPMFYNYTDVTELNELQLYHFSNDALGAEGNIFDNSGANDVDNNYLLNESDSRDLLENIAPQETGASAFDVETALDLLSEDTSIPDLAVAKHTFLSGEVKRRRRQGIIGYIVLNFSNNQVGNRILEYDSKGPRYLTGNTLSFQLTFQSKKTFWRYQMLKKGNTYALETQSQKQFSLNGYTDIDSEVDLDASNQLPQNDPDAPTANELSTFVFPSPNPKVLKYENNKIYSEIYITI